MNSEVPHMLTRRSFGKLGAAASLALLGLAGCAHPQMIDPGSTEEQVAAKLGQPDSRVVLPDGTVRLTYSLQPMGQEVWWMFFDRNGRFTKCEEILNEEHFSLVQPGKMKISDVHQMFGHCAQVYHFKFLKQSAYMYRWQSAGFGPMAFWVQYNDSDQVVTEWTVSEDPWRSEHMLRD